MMINILHLLWIVPLAAYIGMFAMGLLFAAKGNTPSPDAPDAINQADSK